MLSEHYLNQESWIRIISQKLIKAYALLSERELSSTVDASSNQHDNKSIRVSSEDIESASGYHLIEAEEDALQQEIDNLKDKLQELFPDVDNTIFSQNKRLNYIRKFIVLSADLTGLAESAPIAYGIHKSQGIFGVIELPEGMEDALLILVPFIYFINAHSIDKLYVMPNIDAVLEVLYQRHVPEKYRKKWPKLSGKQEACAFVLYAPLCSINILISGVNAFYFMELVPSIFGFKSVDYWTMLSATIATCSGLYAGFTEATETLTAIRKLPKYQPKLKDKTSRLSKSIGFMLGAIGAVQAITENTTTMSSTLNTSSTKAGILILSIVTLGTGIPNTLFRAGISSDASQAGMALLNCKWSLKNPKELLVALETSMFSVLLGESLRNVFLHLMEGNSLPFHVPKAVIHSLALIIALRTTTNSLYCNYPLFMSATEAVFSGLSRCNKALGQGLTKAKNWGLSFFSGTNSSRAPREIAYRSYGATDAEPRLRPSERLLLTRTNSNEIGSIQL